MKNTAYSSLSKDELLLISRAEYENRKLITNEFTKKVFGDAKKAANTVDRLRKKGRLIQIERGKYMLVPIKAPNQLWTPNELVVASLWMGNAPYYIGYFTMYNYWGFTEQVPQTVFILNTQKSRTKKIGDTRYKAIKITERKYYGIEKIKIEDMEIAISDRERTLVDFIYNPIGSFENLKQVIEQNIQKMDAQKFIKYLIQFPEASVRKRAGYILEQLSFSKELLGKLKKSLGRQGTYIVLNMFNKSRKGKINKDWGLIVNT
jgi:predicted transcriptional regulator of viral defense system